MTYRPPYGISRVLASSSNMAGCAVWDSHDTLCKDDDGTWLWLSKGDAQRFAEQLEAEDDERTASDSINGGNE